MDKFLFIATALRYMNDPKDEKYLEMFQKIIVENSNLDEKTIRRKYEIKRIQNELFFFLKIDKNDTIKLLNSEIRRKF